MIKKHYRYYITNTSHQKRKDNVKKECIFIYRYNEIKRHLLLGRKVMTNLDSILKSRDTTLPKRVHLVKAMFFPVVMYGCESWTIKKAER